MRAVPTLRLFIAWLLLLALPLQALAAASMKPCGQAQQQHAAVFTVPAVGGPHADHHDDHHGDAQHHGDPAQAGSGAHHAMAYASAHHSAHDSAPLASTPHDFAAASDATGHACAICAGLCHAVAITSEPPRLRLGAPLAEGPGDAPQRLASVTTSLPDKPPRG